MGEITVYHRIKSQYLLYRKNVKNHNIVVCCDYILSLPLWHFPPLVSNLYMGMQSLFSSCAFSLSLSLCLSLSLSLFLCLYFSLSHSLSFSLSLCSLSPLSL